jgi:UPF0755 protein
VLTIESGETGKSIAKKLDGLDIISSKWAFYTYIKNSGLAPKLEAGTFVLKKSYTIPEIASILLHGKGAEIPLTIREGLTLEQVDQFLAEKQILPKGSFLDCARTCTLEERMSFLDSRTKGASFEGYLFADTYFIDPDTVSPKGLVIRMLRNFDVKLDDSLRSEIGKRGLSIHQVVTMASLIEKESRNDAEKPVISGILWKRLKEKIPLGVDATVRYALQKWTGPLTEEDLKSDSPYNTRKFLGLPPDPISNFGLNSLKAAIVPKNTIKQIKNKYNFRSFIFSPLFFCFAKNRTTANRQ